MKFKVVFVGTDINLNKPIVRNNNWIIPKDWYVLDKNMYNRPNIVYDEYDNSINIIEHCQILHQDQENIYDFSVILTDKKLYVGDIIFDKN